MRVYILLFLALIVTACTTGTNPAGAPVPQLTFDHVKPVPIRVSRVELLDNSALTREDADRSDDFVTPPYVALERYFQRRFVPSAHNGVLTVKLEQASAIVSAPVKKDDWINKLVGWATQQDIYTVSMSFLLDASNGAATRLSMHRQKTMPLNVSLAERERILQEWMDMMIMDLDQATMNAMDKTLRILSVPSDSVGSVMLESREVEDMGAAPQPLTSFQSQQPELTATNPNPAQPSYQISSEPYMYGEPQQIAPQQSTYMGAQANQYDTYSGQPVVQPLPSPETWGQ